MGAGILHDRTQLSLHRARRGGGAAASERWRSAPRGRPGRAEDQPYTFLYSPRATHVLERRLVIVERDAAGAERYRRIQALHGRIAYFFESWRKLAQDPVFAEEG